MRGTVPGLENPHPLSLQLPGVYQEDELAQRFLSGLDEVLAPVLTTLDCIDAYLDPRLAPPDFLPWLAGWMGLDLDETWSVSQQRQAVAAAAERHERRGTAAALKEVLELATGQEVSLEESGGCTWSPTPGGELPGAEQPHLTVRVRGNVSERRIASLVAEHVPANVAWTIELEAAS